MINNPEIYIIISIKNKKNVLNKCFKINKYCIEISAKVSK